MSDKTKVWATLAVCLAGVACLIVSKEIDSAAMNLIGALITGIGTLMCAAIILDSDPVEQSEVDDD